MMERSRLSKEITRSWTEVTSYWIISYCIMSRHARSCNVMLQPFCAFQLSHPRKFSSWRLWLDNFRCGSVLLWQHGPFVGPWWALKHAKIHPLALSTWRHTQVTRLCSMFSHVFSCFLMFSHVLLFSRSGHMSFNTFEHVEVLCGGGNSCVWQRILPHRIHGCFARHGWTWSVRSHRNLLGLSTNTGFNPTPEEQVLVP